MNYDSFDKIQSFEALAQRDAEFFVRYNDALKEKAELREYYNDLLKSSIELRLKYSQLKEYCLLNVGSTHTSVNSYQRRLRSFIRKLDGGQ